MQEVRQLLYGMLKAGFMAVTDIPKTADRAASRTFYTWRVQPESMTEKIGIDTLHAMFNVASRLSVESVLNSEVAMLPIELDLLLLVVPHLYAMTMFFVCYRCIASAVTATTRVRY